MAPQEGLPDCDVAADRDGSGNQGGAKKAKTKKMKIGIK
jgi:hypothetical protein